MQRVLCQRMERQESSQEQGLPDYSRQIDKVFNSWSNDWDDFYPDERTTNYGDTPRPIAEAILKSDLFNLSLIDARKIVKEVVNQDFPLTSSFDPIDRDSESTIKYDFDSGRSGFRATNRGRAGAYGSHYEVFIGFIRDYHKSLVDVQNIKPKFGVVAFVQINDEVMVQEYLDEFVKPFQNGESIDVMSLLEAAQINDGIRNGLRNLLTAQAHALMRKLAIYEELKEVRQNPLLLHEVAGQAAEEVVSSLSSTVTQDVSEQRVREIVAQMIEASFSDLAHSPTRRDQKDMENTVHKLAKGDRKVENLLSRFIRRSKDPEKVVETLIALAAAIPPVQSIAAVVEAINIMLGPEENTR